MHDLGEFLGRLGAHPVRLGLSGRTSSGKARFDLGVAAAQRVIIRVGNGGRVFAVIAAVMFGDLAREPVQFLFRFGGGEFFDGFG